MPHYSSGKKDNCLITKLVYVHEGIEKEAAQLDLRLAMIFLIY